MKTSPTYQEVCTLRDQGKTFQEIADVYGCTRQYIYQIANNQRKRQMKSPSKAELYAQIESLTRENIRLQEQLEAEQRKQWLEKKESAIAMFYRIVPFMPSEMYNIKLEHIDTSGYWFIFELKNDNRKQTMCIRHSDL